MCPNLNCPEKMIDQMSESVQLFKCSADLVKTWGHMRLRNGGTLSDTLTFTGVSLWEVVAPVLALYPVTQALFSTDRFPSIIQRIRPYLVRIKQFTYDSISIKKSCEGCVTWPDKPTWLFLGFSPYMYRDVLQSVVTYLESSDQRIKPVIISDFRRGALVSYPIQNNYQSIWRHWDETVARQLKILRRSLLTAENDFYSSDLPKIFENHGMLSWKRVRSIFTWFFCALLPRILPQLAIADHILRQHRPVMIISPDVADPRTRIYCLMGHYLGIPSLDIQFGIYNPECVEWQFLDADRVAVWGKAARNILLNHGVPDERMITTGSPRYDCLNNISGTAVERTDAQLDIPQGKIVLLFASIYSIREHNAISDPKQLVKVKQTILKVANQSKGLCLIVKPHPLENVRELKKLARGYHNVVFADQHTDIRSLIPACDAFITLGSTATMDAIIAHKLIIFPNFPGLLWCHDMYLENGVVHEVRSEEELRHTLQNLVHGNGEKMLADLEPAIQLFLREWVFKADGQASARIAALMHQMAMT